MWTTVKIAAFSRRGAYIVRIIGGEARGLTLRAPRSLRIRPTPERLKKAIFSSLGDCVVGARVLDLFAGTGSLGMDALSRGAACVVFVEQAAESIRLIRRNIELTSSVIGAGCRYELVRACVFSWLSRSVGQVQPFDIILADPPYPKSLRTGESVAAKLLHSEPLLSMLRTRGWLVLGHSKRDRLEGGENWRLDHCLIHGDSIASFFQKRIL